MGLHFPFRRRILLPRTRNGPFLPTAAGGGLYVFDDYDNELPRDCFELMIRVWWASTSAQDTVQLQFAETDSTGNAAQAGTNRMLILFDDSGELSSFVEDNLGQWWMVPRLSPKENCWQTLMFATTGSDNVNTLNVEIAWVPRWPCSLASLGRMLGFSLRELVRSVRALWSEP